MYSFLLGWTQGSDIHWGFHALILSGFSLLTQELFGPRISKVTQTNKLLKIFDEDSYRHMAATRLVEKIAICFRRANLSGIDLRFVILRDANFSKADLSKGKLRGCDLKYCDFTEANLNETDLSYTNLSKAKLTLASLRGANLTKANLSGVDLTGVDLTKTRRIDNKLTEEVKTTFESSKDELIDE